MLKNNFVNKYEQLDGNEGVFPSFSIDFLFITAYFRKGKFTYETTTY